MVILINKVKVMKAIKLIIIFIVQLGGVVGSLYLLTGGEKDVPISSSDTNMLPGTTVIGDTVIIEDATNKDNRITDPLDEAEDMATTQKSRPKQEAVVNPFESKQSKKSSVRKEKEKPSGRKKEKRHKYTCNICGSHMWFNTEMELNHHMETIH